MARPCPHPEKRRWPGENSARAAISRHATGKRIAVYFCDCGWWHHTSADRPKAKLRRSRR